MNTIEITRNLMAALEHEPRVNLHRDAIAVDYLDGVATLTGEVADIAAKRLALEHAAALPDVRAIIDRLRIRPAERMGDGAIADHLQHSLTSDSAFDDSAIYRVVRGIRTVVRSTAEAAPRAWIEIRVDDGVVTLDGDVASLSHKRLAGALAWWVPGTRDVVNGLGVEPAEDDNDAEIMDALRLVLEKDPLIDATQIVARCTDGVVELEGFLANESQARLAEFDAWAIFGVDRVVNSIKVDRA